MRALLLMFVMLTSSITIAQEGLYLNFDCDYPLRLERVDEVQTLGDTEVFATVSVSSDPNTTVTSIFNNYNFVYNDVVDSHIEDWEQSDYDAYLTDLEGRVYSQILRNERIVILEEAFIANSTATVSISLIDASDGSGDAILFDGGTYSVDLKFNALIEDVASTTFTPLLFQIVWAPLISTVEAEVANIAAAALVAANEANEAEFDDAFNSNTATSTLDRETELEGLSRDGIFVKIVYPFTTGFAIEYHDINGLITLTDNDGDPDPQVFNFGEDLDSLSNYGEMYNNVVTRVRDLVEDLINN